MITRKQKEEAVKTLKDKLSSSSFVAFLNFHGLSVSKAIELRRALKKAGSEYIVAKKTLLGVAAKEAGFDIDQKKLAGEIAIAIGDSEEAVLVAAKELATFERKNKDMLKIIGGFWAANSAVKTWIDATEIKRLAAIPSREVLLTQLAFMLSQPVACLARVLNKLSEAKGQN